EAATGKIEPRRMPPLPGDLPNRCGNGADLGGHSRISGGEFVEFSDFDIFRNHAGPFGAATQEPSAVSKKPCSVECVAGNKQLHVLSLAQVRANDDPIGRAIVVQQKQFERIAQIIMIKLTVADAV